MSDRRARVDVVIPVYNEQAVLAGSIGRLTAHLEARLPYEWRVIIADNASTDETQAIGERLAEADERVRYLRIPQKGRGRALRTAWLGSDAEVVAYMDVDLSTGLEAFLPEALGAGELKALYTVFGDETLHLIENISRYNLSPYLRIDDLGQALPFRLRLRRDLVYDQSLFLHCGDRLLVLRGPVHPCHAHGPVSDSRNG